MSTGRSNSVENGFYLSFAKSASVSFAKRNLNSPSRWPTYRSQKFTILQYRLIPGPTGCFGLAVKRKGAIGAIGGYDPVRF